MPPQFVAASFQTATHDMPAPFLATATATADRGHAGHTSQAVGQQETSDMLSPVRTPCVATADRYPIGRAGGSEPSVKL